MNSGKMESWRLSWLQAFEGSSNLLRSKGVRKYCEPQVMESSIGRTAPCWPVSWTRDPRELCTPFFTSSEAMKVAERGHWRKERPDLPVSLLMVLHALGLSARSRWNWQLPPIAPASSARAEIVGTKRLYQRQSPVGLGCRNDRGSRTLCPSMVHSSSDDHVGCIVGPQIVGSRKNPGMPSQYLMCPEVAISQRIHRWEGKSTSNPPCESSNASPDRCGQEQRASVALWEKADVVTAGTSQEHVCPAVGCPCRNLRRPCLGWCRRSIGEKKRVILIQQFEVVGCCSGIQALTVRRCFVVTPVDMLAVEVANIHTGMWEHRDGRWCESRAWRFVGVNDLVSCDVYAQLLSLWLFWKLIDQWPFQPLMEKCGKAVVPAQDLPS